MKKIEAYYCGALVSPACSDHEEPHSSVSVQYEDGSWQTIMRIGPTRKDWTITRWKLVAYMVEQEMGIVLKKEEAEELLKSRGYSFYRITPSELRRLVEPLRQGNLFER